MRTPHPLRRTIAVLAMASALAVSLVAGPLAAGADAGSSPTTITFDGRGWGHGRGMSQYGAQGYATKFGWTRQQILDHYYGGTHHGTVGQASGLSVDPNAMRIRLMAQDGAPTVVGISDGTLALSGMSDLADPGGLTAVRLTRIPNPQTGSGEPPYVLKVEKASSCRATNWTDLGQSGSDTVTVSKASGAGGVQLQLCRADGVTVWYPGQLRATVHNGTQHTVNITSIEQQLRSVVPSESPASWDADALQAQAVAARSYALAGDSRHQPYADTCDTTLCQVYRGHAQQAPGGSKTATTDSRTDAAINATAGFVRLMDANGHVARTEFSSTSGGYTAGGTFPAVPDEGDVISPRHTWTRTHTMTALESAYGSGGKLVDIQIVQRNGLGADGGRVVQAKLYFSNGKTALVSGNTIRSAVGLWSDWFTPSCTTTARYIQAVFELFVRRAATGADIDNWCGPVRRGERQSLTDILSTTDEWAGVQINDLYWTILRRGPEDGGRAYWLSQVQAGMRIEDIAALFFGSDEYYAKAGSSISGYVHKIYGDLLDRDADGDPKGRDYWTGVLQRGELSRTGVAAQFYASVESRRDRVDALYRRILGRPAETAGRDYWVDQLRTLGDVRLAAHLAASDEFYRNSTAG